LEKKLIRNGNVKKEQAVVKKEPTEQTGKNNKDQLAIRPANRQQSSDGAMCHGRK